jgi:uncharacterized OsmC-like protein
MRRNQESPKGRHILPTLALLLVLAGCNPVSGTYTGNQGMIQSMTFDGGEVEISTMFGIETGTYEVDGDRVHVTIDGDTQTLAINNDGCLDGGMMIGVLCKD